MFRLILCTFTSFSFISLIFSGFCFIAFNCTRPYKGVIAEYNIRRLKNQVREERDKSFPGKSKKKYRAVPPGNYANNNDYDNYTDDNVDYSGSKVRMRRSYSASRLSEENFMEASDYSLETMEAHRMRERDRSRLRDRQSYSSTSTSPYRDRHGKGQGQVNESNNYPSEQYLRGALWLGRNLNMVIEELAEALDFFRSKFLSEVYAFITYLFFSFIVIIIIISITIFTV